MTYKFKIALAGWLIVALVVALASIFEEPALAQNREPSPGDYFFLEFLAGVGGAFVGGISGGILVQKMVTSKEVEEEEAAVMTLVGVGAGLAAGATMGVVVAGSLLGVNGNLLFAPLGAILGVVNAFGIIYWQEVQEGREFSPILRAALVLGAPAFGAAAGYNIGAKMGSRSRT